jgi:hypothetical protein
MQLTYEAHTPDTQGSRSLPIGGASGCFIEVIMAAEKSSEYRSYLASNAAAVDMKRSTSSLPFLKASQARMARALPVIGAVLALLMNSSSPSRAAMVFEYARTGEGLVVSLMGDIAKGDSARFTSFWRSLPATPVVLLLDSAGGSVGEARDMAELIHGSKVATAVLDNHRCDSACFLLFAAGRQRYAAPGVSIGVHGAVTNGRDDDGAKIVDVIMARDLKAFGVPSSVIGELVVTPPADLYQLSQQDLTAMGVQPAHSEWRVAMRGGDSWAVVVMPEPPQKGGLGDGEPALPRQRRHLMALR